MIDARSAKRRRVDWLGAFLVTAGLVLIVFVLSDGSIAPNGWKTPCQLSLPCMRIVAYAQPTDIIALLILGVLLIVVFLFWQHHLERVHDNLDSPYSVFTPPPLMKISIWTRDHGRLSAMLAIIFLEWCSFFGWSFWVQVRLNSLGFTIQLGNYS